MSADMSIHVIEPGEISDEDFAIFNGPLYCGGPNYNGDEWSRCYSLFARTTQIYVGPVSWLKAALFEDAETFVPSPVMAIKELIPSSPVVIGDALIEKVAGATKLENTSAYDFNDEGIAAFLQSHKGKLAFTISW